MARPINAPRVPVRTAPKEGGASPRTEVHASMSAAMPVAPDGMLSDLSRALGLISTVGAPIVKARNDEARAQGAADEAMGQADTARASKSKAYGEGVFQSSVIREFREAEQVVEQWYAAEADKSLGADELTAQADAKFQEALGELVVDPRARLLVAPRYQAFIERLTGTITSDQRVELENESIDSEALDVGRSIEDGTFDFEASFSRLSTVLRDGTKANDALVRMVSDQATQAAAEGATTEQVEGILAAIPERVSSVPRHNETLDNARQSADEARRKFLVPQLEQERFGVLTEMDRVERLGANIGATRIRALIAANVISPEQGAAHMSAAAARREALANVNTSQNAIMATPSNWRNLIGSINPATGKLYTMDGFQKGFDAMVFQLAKGGEDVATVIHLTKTYGIESTALKAHMTRVAGNPAALVENLPAYRALRESGLVAMYITDDSVAAQYALADTRTDGGGQSTQQVIDGLAGGRGKDTADYVTRNAPDARKAAADAVAVPGFWGDTKYSDLSNTMYTQGRLSALTEEGLARGMSPVEAATFASARLAETHNVVTLGERAVLIPRIGTRADGTAVAYDPAVFNSMLAEVEAKLAPKMAADAGLNPAGARMQFTTIPGQETTAQVVDGVGNPVGLPIPMVDLYEQMRRDLIERKRVEGEAVREDARTPTPMFSPVSPVGQVLQPK